MASLDAFDTRTRANQGVEVELKRIRDGAPSGAFVTVLGTDSDDFRRLRAERDRELLKIATEKGVDQIDPEEERAAGARLLAGCIVGWRGLEADGKPLEFSPAAALDLVTRFPAIREQLDRAIARRGNFVLA